MKLTTQWLCLAALPIAATLSACNTHHEIEVKPIDININLSGRLDLVVHDARENVDQIAGEKAQRTVRPEDIGLPPSPATRPGAAADFPHEALPAPIVYLADFGRTPAPARLASEADLTKSMADRYAQMRSLLDTKLAGESHTGLLAARGDLTAAQKTLFEAENSDRAALYSLEAARRKITEAEVALGYYLARLGHARQGDWYEKYNKSTSAWEWKQWGME